MRSERRGAAAAAAAGRCVRSPPCLEVLGGGVKRNKSLAEWRGDNPTNHFPNMTGEELQTWVRGAGIDSPISANNESFPLGSEGGLGRETGEESGRRGIDAGKKRGGAAAAASPPHTEKALILSLLLDCRGRSISKLTD